MLSLRNIVKEYKTGDAVVRALDDISIDFRNHEFVSILGHSGCGKTTMLNLIGGLDHYTSGDLIIRGRSTKVSALLRAFSTRLWFFYAECGVIDASASWIFFSATRFSA